MKLCYIHILSTDIILKTKTNVFSFPMLKKEDTEKVSNVGLYFKILAFYTISVIVIDLNLLDLLLIL